MYKTFAYVVAFLSLCCSTAHAELLWSDVCDVRDRLQTFIRSNIPQGCSWEKSPPETSAVCKKLNTDGLFGYQDLRRHSDSPPSIAYEAVVIITEPCFDKLAERVREIVTKGTPVTANRKASDVFSSFNADGGPTLILYFAAEPYELNDVDHPLYD